MTPRDYAILKRKKVLPLRATLWMYALLLNRRANESGNIPYWFSLLLGLVFWVVLLLIAVVSYPVNVPAQALKVNTVFSFTIIIQLLASEAVNRKVIHSLSHRIVPPVMEKEIWTKMDASIREQLLIPLAGVAIGFPLVLLYAKVLFPGFNIDAAFIFGLAVVLFSTCYGMFMHFGSSMALAHMLPRFCGRLYEFFPAGSPIIRHLANLFSTALLITVFTSIFTVLAAIVIFPSPAMFKLAAIALVSSIGLSIFAFFYHLSAISNLVETCKQRVIEKIQVKIDKINKSSGLEQTEYNKQALEEIGKLIELSEKIQASKPKILTTTISIKYIIAVVGPALPLGKAEYLKAIKEILDSLKDTM